MFNWIFDSRIVEFGNIYYYFYLVLFVVICIGASLLLRNQSERTKNNVIYSILWANFALHFLKLLIPSYANNFPYSIKESTLQNICAINTVIFPFVFLKKNRVLMDYMIYVGLLSGIFSFINPTEALGNHMFAIDSLRFYFCHLCLALAPLLIIVSKMHKPHYRDIWKILGVMVIVLCVIIINEVMMMELGFVSLRNDDLLNPNYRNPSFIFGPSSQFEGTRMLEIMNSLTPDIFLKIPVGEFAGEMKYWPILWMTVPMSLALMLASFIINLCIDPMVFINDIKRLFTPVHFVTEGEIKQSNEYQTKVN